MNGVVNVVKRMHCAFERTVNACIAFANTDRHVRTPASRSQIQKSELGAFERGRASSNAVGENCALGLI